MKFGVFDYIEGSDAPLRKTYDERIMEFEVDAEAAGTAISLANFTTVYLVVVENLGTVALTYVTATLKNAAAATPAGGLRSRIGEPLARSGVPWKWAGRKPLE